MSASNIVLIGMPGSGKSTLGERLAKTQNLQFLDTDALIEQRYGYTLQQLLNRHGLRYIYAIEEQTLCSLNLENHVISTGGSAVYSASAMTHLQTGGRVVYFHISLSTLMRRVNNSATRGLLKPPRVSLQTLYYERLPLYKRWAELSIENNRPLSAWQFDKVAAQVMADESV